MLAQRECRTFESLSMVQDEYLPLFHQLQSKLLRLLQAERKINIFEDMVLQLDGKA